MVDTINVEPEAYGAFSDPGTFEPVVPVGDDIAFQPYIFGSTGRSKGVAVALCPCVGG